MLQSIQYTGIKYITGIKGENGRINLKRLAVELNLINAKLFLHLSLAKAINRFKKMRLISERLQNNCKNRNSIFMKINHPTENTEEFIRLLQTEKPHQIWLKKFNNNCFPLDDIRKPKTILKGYSSLTRSECEIVLRMRSRNFPLGSHRVFFSKNLNNEEKAKLGKCKFCSNGLLENEQHILQKCLFYKNIRPENFRKTKIKNLLNNPKNYKKLCGFIKQTEQYLSIKTKEPD